MFTRADSIPLRQTPSRRFIIKVRQRTLCESIVKRTGRTQVRCLAQLSRPSRPVQPPAGRQGSMLSRDLQPRQQTTPKTPQVPTQTTPQSPQQQSQVRTSPPIQRPQQTQQSTTSGDKTTAPPPPSPPSPRISPSPPPSLQSPSAGTASPYRPQLQQQQPQRGLTQTETFSRSIDLRQQSQDPILSGIGAPPSSLSDALRGQGGSSGPTNQPQYQRGQQRGQSYMSSSPAIVNLGSQGPSAKKGGLVKRYQVSSSNNLGIGVGGPQGVGVGRTTPLQGGRVMSSQAGGKVVSSQDGKKVPPIVRQQQTDALRDTQRLLSSLGMTRNQPQRLQAAQLRSQGNVALNTRIQSKPTDPPTLPTKPPGSTTSSNTNQQNLQRFDELLAQTPPNNQTQQRVQNRQVQDNATRSTYGARVVKPGEMRPSPSAMESVGQQRVFQQPQGNFPQTMQNGLTASGRQNVQGYQRQGTMPQQTLRSGTIQPPNQQRSPSQPSPGADVLKLIRPGQTAQPVQQAPQEPVQPPPIQAPVQRPAEVSRKRVMIPQREPDLSIDYPKSEASEGRLLPYNEDIQTPMVRLVEMDGQQIGILTTEEAMALADEQDVDLLLINQDSKPPIAKLMKYDKYKFEKEKADRESRKKSRQSQVDTKELKLKPNTDVHDYQVRVKNAIKFLTKGDKVKITLSFRGREIEFKDVANALMQKFQDDTMKHAVVEIAPYMQGRNLVMLLAPVSKK